MSAYFEKVFAPVEKPESYERELRLIESDPITYVQALREQKTEHFTEQDLRIKLHDLIHANKQQALATYQSVIKSDYRHAQYNAAMKNISTYETALAELKKDSVIAAEQEELEGEKVENESI